MDKVFLNKIELLEQFIQEAYCEGNENISIIKNTNRFIANIILKVEILEITFLEKAEKLKNLIEDEVVKYISKYDKKELQIGLLALKAYYRSIMSNANYQKEDYEISNMHEEILELLNIISKLDNTGNKSILNVENFDIPYVLRLMYFYNVLEDNTDHLKYKLSNKEDIIPETLSLLFKEAIFYSKEYDKYMSDLLLESEVPEDLEIKTKLIEKKMIQKKIDKEYIRDEVDNVIHKYYGFTFEDLNNFACWGLRQKNPLFCVALEKDDYFNKLNSEYGMQRTAFDKIINLLTLNNCIFDKNIDSNRVIELRSIFEFDDVLIFYCFDIIHNIDCFEKFVKRKHFVEYFTTGWNEELKKGLNNELSKYEEKMSSYLAYAIADVLYRNQYILPIDNENCPYAEVTSIIEKNGKNMINILRQNKDCGDIDVLAANIGRKEIYNIEIKYYKPLHQLYEISSDTKLKERDKNVITPLKRGSLLDEKQEVVKEFLKIPDKSEYKVRTILVSPRPDYWFKSGVSSIEYYSLGDFFKKVYAQNL